MTKPTSIDVSREQAPLGWALLRIQPEVISVAAVHVLFALMVVLQAVDLCSSFGATTNQWEINPFLQVLGEQVGPVAALFVVKGLCFVVLGGLYALWRRVRMDTGFCVALAFMGLVYAPPVFNNYLGR